VSVLPNGPADHPTVRVFMAGGVPEVMLHLRKLGVVDTKSLTVSGQRWDDVLDWWQQSERRFLIRRQLLEQDGVDPDEVILTPQKAKAYGLTSTVTFPTGNIAPQGAVIKSTSIDASRLDENGRFCHLGPAKIFTSERAAIYAIKRGSIVAGDVIVLMGRGPSGTGMEETYQLTSALKHLPFGKQVSLITDARFSGVSTGACIGHIGPEALAGGPIGKLRDGDLIEIVIDREQLSGTVHMVGMIKSGSSDAVSYSPEEGARCLETRETHPDLAADPLLPDDTRLWAALQEVSGGTWSGSIYDVNQILKVLEAGKRALQQR
jgi:putative YjhG/YagF family dehydratase